MNTDIASQLRVTLVQSDLVWAEPAQNHTLLGQLLAEIEVGSSDLIVLPEMFSTGFTMNPAEHAERQHESLNWLREQAARLGAVITGSVAVADGGRYYNRLYWVRPDGTHAHYDKRHLFGLAGEDKVYTAGTERLLCELAGWRIRPVICYDIRFPVWLRNTDEYDVLLVVANWPERRIAHWNALLPARAIENQAFVVAVNRIGEDAGAVMHNGDSCVISPMGELLLRDSNNKMCHTVTLERSQLTDLRQRLPFLSDRDDFVLLDKASSMPKN